MESTRQLEIHLQNCMEIWNSCVQLMKNKSSERWYEKHSDIKCTRKIFYLFSSNKKRIRRKVIIIIILEKEMGKNKREKVKRNRCIEEAKISK